MSAEEEFEVQEAPRTPDQKTLTGLSMQGSPRRSWCSPDSNRSKQTILKLTGIRQGYTSPKLRRTASATACKMLSLHDAAWEGDTAGVSGLLFEQKPKSEAKPIMKAVSRVKKKGAIEDDEDDTISDEPAVEPEVEEALDVNKLGYLSMNKEGLCLKEITKGYNTTLSSMGGRAATPLMYAVVGKKLDTVKYLLDAGADCAVTAELRKGEKITLQEIVFLNTFWNLAPKDVARARQMKALVLGRSPPSPLQNMTMERVTSFLNRSVFSKDFAWDIPTWVQANELNGGKLESWVAADWKTAGNFRIVDLQKLVEQILVLFRRKRREPREESEGDGTQDTPEPEAASEPQE